MPSKVDMYVETTNRATEIVRALLELEGGRLIVAMFIELTQSMLDAENIDGAILTLQEMAGVVDAAMPNAHLEHGDEGKMLIYMLIEVMRDVLNEN